MAQPSPASAQAFVQVFYNWYVPIAIDAADRQGSGQPADIVAVRKKTAMFDLPLAAALERDWAAQVKCRGYTVGLDWDPIANTDDPDVGYSVGDVLKTPGGYRVAMNAAHLPDGETNPLLYAEVAWRKDHWVFVDFADHDGEGVMAVMAGYRRSGEYQACPSVKAPAAQPGGG